jgi:hypothetical protein
MSGWTPRYRAPHMMANDSLVVTHHAPIVRGVSLPEHTLSPLNCAFATDLRHS